MSDLEDLGYVSSPHTSAGRVPTNLGYRFFVDTLVKVDPLDTYDLASLNKSLDPDMTSQELIESASGLLSEFTRMAGLVTLPKREQILLRHVEFLSLEGNRVLVILVLDGVLLVSQMQHRIIHYLENVMLLKEIMTGMHLLVLMLLILNGL